MRDSVLRNPWDPSAPERQTKPTRTSNPFLKDTFIGIAISTDQNKSILMQTCMAGAMCDALRTNAFPKIGRGSQQGPLTCAS